MAISSRLDVDIMWLFRNLESWDEKMSSMGWVADWQKWFLEPSHLFYIRLVKISRPCWDLDSHHTATMKHWQWTALWTDIRTSINQRKKKGMSTWTSELPIGSMVLVYMLTLGVYWWQMLPYIAAPWILWVRIYQDISGHSPAAPFRDQLNQVHRATVFVAPACTDRWRRRPVKFGWP
jgi:hypothetical protein